MNLRIMTFIWIQARVIFPKQLIILSHLLTIASKLATQLNAWPNEEIKLTSLIIGT